MNRILIYENSLISKFQVVDEEVNAACKRFKEIFLANRGEKIEIEVFNLNYVLRELINNAIEHGNRFEITKKIEVKVNIIYDFLIIEVQDSGKGFDLAEVINKVDADVLRERNRGLESILKMGFKIQVNNNKVMATQKMELISADFTFEDMAMDVLVENNIAICTLNKNLTANNIKEFVEILKILIGKSIDYNRVIFDLSRTENIDSMGITFLIGTYKSFATKDKKVSLIGVSDGMLQLFKLMRLDDFFEIKT